MVSLNILIYPAHGILDPDYGSEQSWAYNMIYKSARLDISFRVICGICKVRSNDKVKIYEIGINPFISPIHRSLFLLKSYLLAKKVLKRVDVVHHMFPFGFGVGFNPLAVTDSLGNKPFVIGPIQFPQTYGDTTDALWRSQGKIKAIVSMHVEGALGRSTLVRKLHEKTIQDADALIFDSRKTLELYRRIWGDLLRGKILTVLPPGVEFEIFNYRPPVKKPYVEILTVGYLTWRKGVHTLIKAMPIILQEYKDVKLRIVGDGPVKTELMRLAEKVGVGGHVIFEGKVERRKLPAYYANADIYVQPSLSETFPSAVREAMAVGRPVVATNVGTISEYIIDGVTGFIVSPNDVLQLSRRIIRLISEERERIEIGQRAYEYARQNFNYDKISEKLFDIYNELL